MLTSLYEHFQYWSEKGQIWIISDPHFEDNDCILMNKDWITPQAHIDIINKHVTKNDTLICLGDCGNLEWIKKIKANYKVLIKGNHDDKGNYYYKREIITREYMYSTIKELANIIREEYPNSTFHIINTNENIYKVKIDNKLFDEVYEGALFISEKILLSHEPIYNLPFCVNIHGHCHNGKYVNEAKTHYNLASDVVDFKPINLNKLIKNGILKHIKTIHRLVIDNRD